MTLISLKYQSYLHNLPKSYSVHSTLRITFLEFIEIIETDCFSTVTWFMNFRNSMNLKDMIESHIASGAEISITINPLSKG